jgi:hypothetical protein
MNLSGLKVPYFVALVLRIHRSYFRGHDKEEERQWADRVLERLNNTGGEQRVVQ